MKQKWKPDFQMEVMWRLQADFPKAILFIIREPKARAGTADLAEPLQTSKAVMKMITFRDVSKIYHIGGEEVRALDHASMQIEQGEFVEIIGPSGSGKSTLMNIMGCLDVADEGEYILDASRSGIIPSGSWQRSVTTRSDLFFRISI